MDECLVYFRQAVNNPASVPPWSEWWSANEPVVEAAFSFVDYVRLKHRRLMGARQILQRLGELPRDFIPPDPSCTLSCFNCGERVLVEFPGDGNFRCHHCGSSTHDHYGPASDSI